MLADLAPLVAFEAAHIHYQMPAPPDHAGMVVRVGTIPILFSAPHSCQHKRNGYWKQEDEYTATIAEWLHQLTGAYAMYLVYQLDPDPHDDDDTNPYKQMLAKVVQQHSIRLVIDLHGAKGNRRFGMALGTIHNASCPTHQAMIVRALQEADFSLNQTANPLDHLAINHPRYTGGVSRPTVTRFVQQSLGIEAAQLELNAWLRVIQRLPQSTNAQMNNAPDFRANPLRFRRMMIALTSLVQDFERMQK